MMLKHIHISELKPGMHIASPDIDWKTRPYLYCTDEHVSSMEQVSKIMEQGFLEVYIDLDRSDAVPAAPALAQSHAFGKPKEALHFTPVVALDEELPKAVEVHNESVAYARRFMNDMRTGKINMSSAARNMEGILGSLERNADALVTLARLHKTDSYTYTHCVNVCIFTTLFARYQGADSNAVFVAGLAGMFHDLGKALIPLQILNAPRRLSEAEFAVMKSHPTLGYEQLASVPGISPDVLLGTVQHHEKFNGTGYPRGLSGENISDIGRMVGIADIYDALTSKRPYKFALCAHKALGMMYEMREKDLDTDYLTQFIRMLGVYPVGCVVEMEDGSMGVVTASNDVLPLKPTVTVVRAPGGEPQPPKIWRLDSDTDAPGIARCIPADLTDIQPLQVLGMSAG